MHRRSFLTRGVATVAGASVVAGCLGDGGGGGGDPELPGTTPDESTTPIGLAPDEEDVDPEPIDVDSLETTTTFDVEVPLLPIDVAYSWYRSREARFVDARVLAAYEESHVAGAVHSPAPRGYETDDPTSNWAATGRVVTYCTCPHHLSTQRAASLIENGYEAAFALDEGFGEWYDRRYPMNSSNGAVSLGDRRAVTGRVDADHAGEYVWLRHEATGQREPAEIEGDGSFEVTFRFVRLEAEDALVLETPAGTRRGTVVELSEEITR